MPSGGENLRLGTLYQGPFWVWIADLHQARGERLGRAGNGPRG